MLPRTARLRKSESFRQVIRRGRRSGTRTVVLHWLADDELDASQVGFVVSKAVGNAVERNRVKRRLRHLTREHLTALPGCGVLVVRANPAASSADHAELAGDLVRGLSRLQPSGRAPSGTTT